MSVTQKSILDLENLEPVASAIFDYLATRQRHTSALTVDRAVKAVPGTTKSEMISVFRELEKIGLGVLLLGRKGAKTRFAWLVSPANLQRARTGELDPVPLSVNESDSDDFDEDDEDEDEDGLVTHTYRLRRDLTISIKLPHDLTDKEASRLGQFLTTVPFDS